MNLTNTAFIFLQFADRQPFYGKSESELAVLRRKAIYPRRENL